MFGVAAVGVGDDAATVDDVAEVAGMALLLVVALVLLLVGPIFVGEALDEGIAGVVEFGAGFVVSDPLLAFTRLKTSEYEAEF